MTVKQVEDYLRQYGMLMYEKTDEKDRRKKYYELLYPIFNGNEKKPSSDGTRLEKRAYDIYKYAKELLEDAEYKEKCIFWINNY